MNSLISQNMHLLMLCLSLCWANKNSRFVTVLNVCKWQFSKFSHSFHFSILCSVANSNSSSWIESKFCLSPLSYHKSFKGTNLIKLWTWSCPCRGLCECYFQLLFCPCQLIMHFCYTIKLSWLIPFSLRRRKNVCKFCFVMNLGLSSVFTMWYCTVSLSELFSWVESILKEQSCFWPDKLIWIPH